jgi:glycosyltransferase involved in cell wall biosynthesis
MQVALLNGNWYPQTGGGIVHVKELANRLARDHGATVDIITKRTSRSEADETDRLADGVRLIQVSHTDTASRVLNELRYTQAAVSRVRRGSYDIVHAHTNTATFPLQLLRVIDDGATVLTVHGAQLDLSVTFTGSALDTVYTHIRRLILTRFSYDAVISVSNELAEVLVPSHETVRYIPNGVDITAFPEPNGYGGKQILFVGRLRPKKNPTDVIQAMQYVTEHHPEATLHIVGEGPLADTVATAVEQYDVTDNVIVHGFVDEETLHRLYQECSVFVLPSEWEGHPLVLLEAWASGQVVIGTEVEGIREFIAEGVGETVPLNSPQRIGEILVELFASSSDLETKGKAARRFVAEKYSWDATVKQTYDLYCDLLGPARPENGKPTRHRR